MVEVDELGPGEIGFITASIKDSGRHQRRRHHHRRPQARDAAAAGLQAGQPVVFCGLFPVDAAEFRGPARRHGQAAPQRRQLLLRDGNLAALGFGFRCGFLGLLHLEIIQERLEREFDLDLIATAPSVVYKPHMTSTASIKIELHNPADMPDVMKIDRNRGAVDQGHDPHARRISRRHPQALPGPARHPEASSPMSASAPW
jgi:GTP-binding protein LepA